MEDSLLIGLFFERDEAAVGMTKEKYGKCLFDTAYNILRDREDSEECVNDTLIKAWDTIPPLRPVSLKAYLVKIARNLAFDRYKAKNRHKRGSGRMDAVLSELSECLPSSETVESRFDGMELARSISRFLRGINDRDRDIFLRRYFYAEGISGIARVYAMKEANVRLILSRTRNKLKKHLESEELI